MVDQIMFMEAQVSAFYQPINVGDVNASDITEAVKGMYLPAVQSWGPNGNPLLVMNSEHGSSQIVIAEQNILLSTVFTPRWRKDRALGINYLTERVPLLQTLLARIDRLDKQLYVGSTVLVEIESDRSDSELLSVIQRRFGGDYGDDLEDLTIRTSRVIDDAYYQNSVVQNFRRFSVGFAPTSQTRVDNDDAEDRGIQIQIDFNSRYSYNRSKALRVTDRDIKHAISRAFSAGHAEAGEMFAVING